MSTRPLRPAPPRFPLDVHPLARLHEDGRFEPLGPAFPPAGELVLALWRPGADPAFRLARGTLERGWRWRGPGAGAWVVAWDPAQPF